MNRYLSILVLFYSINSFAQDDTFKNKMILFEYSYQVPITNLANDFGNNSSMGLCYLQNKNDFLLGFDANFMFGGNVRDTTILQLISTDDGFLINASGELDEVLLYERGINTHLMTGKSFRFEANNLTGIYIYGGLGYLQHKIRLESNRTTLPQIEGNYLYGYDKFTNGLSTKICIDYMYFDKKNSIKYHIGTEFINAFTTIKRRYNFAQMEEFDQSLKLDQIVGLRFGIIIPINRNNEAKFHYY
ncbi:MAG: hypothetical protein CMD02_05505 [Flavobacteriales bacterium]|nr:hypothetical protein [Flavobacteriales bacterium]|tara:strand:- start:224 stop:958 length:735 start_codon:yes stop_codon:yes gene_type:complete